MTVIKLINVTKQFKLRDTLTIKRYPKANTIDVLQDINLNLSKGEALAVIGSNGAGKSTLLRVITGIIKPTSGNVFVKGTITPVFDTGSIFRFELTGRENIYYYGSLLGFSRTFLDKNIRDIIEFSELNSFIDVKVKKYSLGMISRLAFSIATSQCPDILIIDEVQAVGDRIFRQKSFNRIASMKKRGATIVFVTQSTDEVMILADKALYLKQGRMKKHGKPSEVIMQYIEDTESQLKKSLSESIFKLYDELKNPSKKFKIKEKGFFGLNLFNKKEVHKEKSSSGIKLELEEKIRLLKQISLDEIYFFEKFLEKEKKKDIVLNKKQLLKKVKKLIELINLELDIIETGKDQIYSLLIMLKQKERKFSGDINIYSMDYDLLSTILEQLCNAENDYLKSKLIDKLYGLRELSKLQNVSLHDEKELINKYVSFLQRNSAFDIKKRAVEFLRLLLTISAFNTRLDKKFLSKVRKSFFEFIKADVSQKNLNSISEEISKFDNIYNWGNENYVYISTEIVEFFFKLNIENLKFNKYLSDYAVKVLAELDGRIIALNQELFEDNNKTTTNKLNLSRIYRNRLSKLILKMRLISKPKETRLIKNVTCFDNKEKEKNSFMTNAYFKLRIYYNAEKIIKTPVFGISLYTDTGVLVTGPNTMHHGYKIGNIFGKGYVDYVIKKLPLLPGHYLISVAVHPKNSFKPYDSIDKLYSFEVLENQVKDFGNVYIKAEWQHSKKK